MPDMVKAIRKLKTAGAWRRWIWKGLIWERVCAMMGLRQLR
jgi:hypothetical protein